MDAPGRLHHQLIPRIIRGCIYIKGVNNKSSTMLAAGNW